MTMRPGEGDRTVRATGYGEATVPAGGDTTIPVGPAGGGPTGPTEPAPPGGPEDDGVRHPGPLLAGVTAAGIIVGAVVGLLVGGGGSTPTAVSTTTSSSSTTTSSSSTTTSSTTTTTTTTPAAPQVLAFTVAPTNPPCNPGTRVQLTWSTQNAQSVTLSADGTPLGSVGASGQSSAPFSCPPTSHTYQISVTGPNGRVATRSVGATGVIIPSTTTTSSTTTTTTSLRRGGAGRAASVPASCPGLLACY